MKRIARRVGAGVGAVVALIGLSAGAASAHVTISTLGAVAPGSSDVSIGFSVPNERSDADTIELDVQFPKDHPMLSVLVQPKAGWTATTTMRKLDTPLKDDDGNTVDQVVDTVTWKATGGGKIAPGQYDVFWVSAGPMPTDATEVGFPAVQVYSSGDKVSWIEPPNADGSEPDHPIPTLKLTSAEATATSQPATQAAPQTIVENKTSSGLAVVALIVAIVALVAGAGAFVIVGRKRRPAPSA